jgi:hypothetical protein
MAFLRSWYHMTFANSLIALYNVFFRGLLHPSMLEIFSRCKKIGGISLWRLLVAATRIVQAGPSSKNSDPDGNLAGAAFQASSRFWG